MSCWRADVTDFKSFLKITHHVTFFKFYVQNASIEMPDIHKTKTKRFKTMS